MTFDAFELCSPELQQRLKPVRDKFEAIEEAEAEAKMSGKLKQEKTSPKNNENEKTKEYERYDFPEGKSAFEIHIDLTSKWLLSFDCFKIHQICLLNRLAVVSFTSSEENIL